MPEQLKSGADYYLNIHVKTKEDSDWAKAGYEVAYAQFTIDAKSTKVAHTLNGKNVQIKKQSHYFIVSGKDFRFKLNLDTGLLESYYYKDQLLMKEAA